MQTKYFTYTSGTTTAEQLKAQFKRLCKHHHPDAGGSNTQFIEMKKEYNYLLLQITNPACEPKPPVANKMEETIEGIIDFGAQKAKDFINEKIKNLFK